MEQPGQYSRHPGQLFQSSQHLPPPQLHLPPPSSFSRSNTLPPISNIPSASSSSSSSHQNHRFAPVNSSYSGGSGNVHHSSVLPPLPSPSGSSSHSWPALHRMSNSREELHPSQQQQHQHQQDQRHSRGERDDRPIKRESASSQSVIHHEPQPPPPPPSQHHHTATKESNEDGMPSTSDFVKKLYK
jgi:osomolarity two-component system, response regulator SKN7